MVEKVGGLTSLEEVMLKALQSRGAKFRTQVPTRSGFVLDFLIGDTLVIETDGPCHSSSRNKKRDRFRDKILRQNGYKVLRISYKTINDPQKFDNWLNSVLGPPL
jgi:very-short-patch-repair endonuclease